MEIALKLFSVGCWGGGGGGGEAFRPRQLFHNCYSKTFRLTLPNSVTFSQVYPEDIHCQTFGALRTRGMSLRFILH